MQSQNMSMMDHSNHNMASDASIDIEKPTETSSEECCTKTCNCFTGGCSSFAVIMKNASAQSAIYDLSLKIFSHSSLALSQQPKSLYRPPIIS